VSQFGVSRLRHPLETHSTSGEIAERVEIHGVAGYRQGWYEACEDELREPAPSQGEQLMIHLTPAAVKAISRFVKATETPVAGLRIFVSGGGCAGLQYGLRLEQDKGDDDLEFDVGAAARLLVDPLSSSMLDGLTVDFVDSLTQTGFKFNNPNVAGACACGQSFAG
jgi:iron-sulfur cluster assembly protein